MTADNTDINKEIIEQLINKFSENDITIDSNNEILSLTVPSTLIRHVILFLKEEIRFNFLTDICGVHYPEKHLALGVVYHLHNFEKNIRIRIKTFVKTETPVIETICGIFSAANWMERETYDFFGILFEGHPNLKRILNMDNMDYFPMRKEYPLEDELREDKNNSFFGR